MGYALDLLSGWGLKVSLGGDTQQCLVIKAHKDSGHRGWGDRLWWATLRACCHRSLPAPAEDAVLASVGRGRRGALVSSGLPSVSSVGRFPSVPLHCRKP